MSGIANQVSIQTANAYFDSRAQAIFAAMQNSNWQAWVEEFPMDGQSLVLTALGPNPVVEEMVGSQVFSAWRAYARMKAAVPYNQRGLELTVTQIKGDRSGMTARAIDNYLANASSFWWKPMVDLLVSNPVGIDGVSILNDSHPYAPGGLTWDNKVTTAFSPAALNTAVIAGTSLKTEAGMPYGIRYDTLMVEPTNERDAKDAIGVMRPIPVDSSGLPNAGASVVAAVSQENWLKGQMKLIVEPLLTTTTDWLVMDLSKPGCRPIAGGILSKPEPIITLPGSTPHMNRDVVQYALRGHAALMGYVPQTIYGRLG
jgi:hypothetical protein